MSIQEQLKKAQECSGKTFQELADKNNVSKQAYHQKIFNRMPSLKNLISFANDVGFDLVARNGENDIIIKFVREDFEK